MKRRTTRSRPTDAPGRTEDTRRLWRDHRQGLRETRRRPTARNVHALRIGTRRLLAHLELVRALETSTRLKRVRRRLRRLLRQTGPARDARVQLRLFERILPDANDRGRHKFHRMLQRRDRRLAEELARKLKRHESAGHGLDPHRLFRPLAETATPSRPAATTLRLAARRVLVRQRAAGAGAARDCHRLRVALKKFRYLVEAGTTALDRKRAAGLARLQAAQSALGELHDFDLLLERLGKFAPRHPATARWLEARHGALQRRRQTLVRRPPALRFTAAQLRLIAGVH